MLAHIHAVLCYMLPIVPRGVFLFMRVLSEGALSMV
jgi:hypothetical protein